MPNALVNVALTGGVNLLKDPRRIRDDQLVLCKNMVPVVPGILKTRLGTRINSFVHEDGPGLSVPLSMFPIPLEGAWPDLVYIIRSVSDARNTTAIAGNFTSNGTEFTADLGAITGGIPAVVISNGKVYVFGGAGCLTPGKIFEPSGVTYAWSSFAFAGSGNTDIYPKVAAVYRERVLYANLGPGYESAMILSDTGEPTVIGNSALGSRDFTAGDGDGDRIVAVQEITQTAVGNPTQAAALVLKEFSAYILTGLPTETAETFDIVDFEVNKISFPCGCASKETMVQTPYGLIWAGPDDVWFFATGQLPVRIGTNIRPALARTPVGLRYRWHAAYHNGFYRLAIFGEGQGPNDDSPCLDQWWLDLRDGAPGNSEEARWWGPQQYTWETQSQTSLGDVTEVQGTYCLSTTKRFNQEEVLYTLVPGYQNQAQTQNHIHSAYFDVPSPRDSDLDVIANIKYTVTQWVTLTPYVVGNFVYYDDRVYKCIANGTTGATAPATYYEVVDGTAKWRYVGTAFFDYAASDNKPNIETELVTKIYDFGEPLLRKIFQGAELDLYTSDDGQLLWDVYLDDGREVSTSNTEALQDSGAIAGLAVVDATVMSREFQSISLSPSSGSRFLGKLIQFRLRNQPGYLIQEGFNDELVMGWAATAIDDPLDSFVFVVTIPAGFYTSHATLMTALQTAINTGLTGTGATATVSRAEFGVINIVASAGYLGVSTSGALDLTSGATAGVPQRTAAMLGFEGGSEIITTATAPVTKILNGISPLHTYSSAMWELGSIVLRVRAVPRRPA